MKILIVGGAGYVGSIIRPAFEAEHQCRFFDLRAIPGKRRGMVVGDVLDQRLAARAVRGMDAVVYMPLGTKSRRVNLHGIRKDIDDIPIAFGVNTTGFYSFAFAGLAAGVRKFVYASTFNVYDRFTRPTPLDESDPPNAWDPYGLSKRCAEMVCDAAAQECPEAVVISLRLYAPKNQKDFQVPPKNFRPGMLDARLGPEDTTSLFLAAVACNRKGSYVIHATGDVKQVRYKHARARRVLGWRPVGK